MRRVFVDTSGWMACADAADPVHARCIDTRDAWLRSGGVLVSTDYVVDETLTLLRMRLGLAAARVWWDSVSRSARVRLVHLDGDTLDAARSIFFRYRDKDFSYTDCTSFALMRAERIRSALATDRHFAQAGFRCLPER